MKNTKFISPSVFFVQPGIQMILSYKSLISWSSFTIFDADVDSLPRTKPLLPTAGYSLPLVIHQLDWVVHKLGGLEREVRLSVNVNNTENKFNTIFLNTRSVRTCSWGRSPWVSGQRSLSSHTSLRTWSPQDSWELLWQECPGGPQWSTLSPCCGDGGGGGWLYHAVTGRTAAASWSLSLQLSLTGGRPSPLHDQTLLSQTMLSLFQSGHSSINSITLTVDIFLEVHYILHWPLAISLLVFQGG